MSAPRDPRHSIPDQPTVLDIESSGNDESLTLLAGVRVGPYRITRLLGEGGMGAVYLAEQLEPIQRPVALKLIRGQLQGGLAEAYFMVERQALARMEHPAIAKVYDAGTTPQGHPFFAMEWIDGLPLGEYRASHALNIDDVLELFVRICMGVQHAHQRGVIHRDLKPSNVLIADVDGEPMPKIIDFGIAIGASQSTGGESTLVQSAGTRGYMSPEQTRGKVNEIDVRSDIYALGVMLLELLMSNEAMDRAVSAGADNRELHAALLVSLGQSAPARAELVRVVAPIPAELRWSIVRATDPNRTKRYESAQAFADDLQRFRRHYPMRAVPSTSAYRLRSFAARNRGPILAASFILIALIAGTTAAVIGLLNARDAAARANLEAEKSRQTSQFLSDILSSVRPEEARDLDKTLLHKILDNAGEKAAKQLANQPEALAQIQATIGNSYASLSEFKPAIENTRRAEKIAHETLGADALETLRIDRQLGDELSNAGQVKEAEKIFENNIAAFARTRGADDKETLKSRSVQVELLTYQGKYVEAENKVAPLVSLIEQKFGKDSDEALNIGVINAEVLTYQGKYEQAESIYRVMVEEHKKVYGDDHPKTLDVLNKFAIMNLEANRFADGEKILRAMLPICEKIYGPNHAFTIEIVSNLGGALRQQGTPEKIAESGPYYQRALDETRARYGDKNQNTVMATHNYGNYLLDVDKVDEAIATQQHALVNSLEVFGADTSVTGEVHYGLGKALLRALRYSEAEKQLLLAIEEKQKDFGPDHWRLREYLDPLIDTYAGLGYANKVSEWEAKRAALKPKPATAS